MNDKIEFNEYFLMVDRAKSIDDLKKVCLFLLDKVSELSNATNDIKDDIWGDYE